MKDTGEVKATFIRILFELEVICPLGYFDIVIHLVLHLPTNIFADPDMYKIDVSLRKLYEKTKKLCHK